MHSHSGLICFLSIPIRIAAATILPILTSLAMAQTPKISYTLGMSKPATHIFEVTYSLDGLDSTEEYLDIALPVWRTGRYLVLDFANGIVAFNVADGSGSHLAWRKTDKSTWRIDKHSAQKVIVSYSVFANEFAMRTRGLNDERAFVDGTGVFFYAEHFRHLPVTLTVIPFANWHVTTGLDSVKGQPNTFAARDYDYLVDCPLEIGTQRDFSFMVEGKEHVLSITGDGNYESEKLIADVTKIINTTSAFWGGLPYDRYVFQIALMVDVSGGTEHINSTTIAVHPFAFRNPESYRIFLSTVAHEFFHAWNVKRLRPAGFEKFDWTKENYVRELWIAEGMTSYFDELILSRSGLTTSSLMLDRLSGAIDADRARPGYRSQSLSECSYDAWIKYWKNTQQAYNLETDYYVRGASVSFILDMTIRERTKNKYALDHVLQLMYRRFPEGKRGYTNGDFQKACEEVAGSSFQEFFANYVDGTMALPWEAALAVIGYTLEEKSPDKNPWLGLHSRDIGDRTVVSVVVRNSPAYEAGLDVGDELLALNGYRVRSKDLSTRTTEMKEGDKVRLTLFRNGKLREFDVTLKNQPFTSMKIAKMARPTSLQKSVFESWLGIRSESTEKK